MKTKKITFEILPATTDPVTSPRYRVATTQNMTKPLPGELLTASQAEGYVHSRDVQVFFKPAPK